MPKTPKSRDKNIVLVYCNNTITQSIDIEIVDIKHSDQTSAINETVVAIATPITAIPNVIGTLTNGAVSTIVNGITTIIN